jgi:hypothetical protein
VSEPNDPQHAAFADSDESDWAKSEELLAGAIVHEPDDPGDTPVRTPEEWDEEGWDAERQPPKTIEDARQALAGRIADPEAPDDASHAGAYGEPGGES